VVGEQPIDLVIKCGQEGIEGWVWMKMGRPLSRNARPKGQNKAGRRDVEPARSSLSVRSGRNVVKLSTRQKSPTDWRATSTQAVSSGPSSQVMIRAASRR
jgi:hypothetical protein